MREWCTKYKVPFWGATTASIFQNNLRVGELNWPAVFELSAPMYTYTLHTRVCVCGRDLLFVSEFVLMVMVVEVVEVVMVVVAVAAEEEVVPLQGLVPVSLHSH